MNTNHVDPIPMAAVDAAFTRAARVAALQAYTDGVADLEEWLDLSTLHAVDRWETLRRVQAIITDAQAAAALAGPSQPSHGWTCPECDEPDCTAEDHDEW